MRLALFLLAAAVAFGQQANDPNAWGSKTIQLKYIDPEQLRSLYAGQSYVMQVNRELKLLKINGPQSFLKEVEDTGKQLDVPSPAPADIQVTVYLLATAAQAPAAPVLPADLKPLDASLAAIASLKTLRLADTQVLRLREGQVGEISLTDSKSATAPALTRVRVQSAVAAADAKSNRISLDGVRCWISKPGETGASSVPAPSASSDFAANIDLTSNQPTLLAAAGTEKPLILAVRATVVR